MAGPTEFPGGTMDQHQRTKELFDESTWPVAVWTAFWIMALVELLWFAFGGYIYLGGIFDPVFLLAFGFVCVLVLRLERFRRGSGLSVRAVMVVAAFLASLVFVLTRYQVGLGDTSDVNLVVTVRDADSGRPVAGATVTVSDGRKTLARAVSDGRGRAALDYRRSMWTNHSWLLSWRTFEPEAVTVQARAGRYSARRIELEHQVEYRLHLVQEPLRHPYRPVSIQLYMNLVKNP